MIIDQAIIEQLKRWEQDSVVARYPVGGSAVLSITRDDPEFGSLKDRPYTVVFCFMVGGEPTVSCDLSRGTADEAFKAMKLRLGEVRCGD